MHACSLDRGVWVPSYVSSTVSFSAWVARSLRCVDTGARLRESEREAGVFGCDPARLSLLRRPMGETPALRHIVVACQGIDQTSLCLCAAGSLVLKK
jgi:hypothetical protein